jgi:hypothetical protein
MIHSNTTKRSANQYSNYLNKKGLLVSTATTVGYLLLNTATAQVLPIIKEGPVNPDFWVATDGLKRSIPTFTEAGGKKSDKTVGMFYYLWHGGGESATFTVSDESSDVEKVLKDNPQNPLLPNPNVQKTGKWWYWGEPELGYYRSDDPWAIRKNLIMLSNAGVDFIFFDGTNGFPYISRATAIFDEALAMQNSGIKVPKIAWMNKGSDTTQTQNAAKKVFEFYKDDKYKSLWYMYDGKPLMLLTSDAIQENLPADIKKFFTFKYSWAKSKDMATEPDKWQWLDSYPQTPGWSGTPKNIEQISVSKGEHAHSFTGSSATYVNGVKTQPPLNNAYKTPRTGYSDYFSQQWSEAHKVNPPLVMVTQWNESLGQCFADKKFNDKGGIAGIKFLGRPVLEGECGFVDIFNAEFNRDIQPSKNEYSDNDYYLLVNNVRKYKGVSKQPDATPVQPMAINGNFAKWQTVGPVFMDIKGDTVSRDWPTAMTSIPKYVNTTGRNDIVASRVMASKNNVYFYVRTDKDITPNNGDDWMQLWIDSDSSTDTGFRGYDYAIVGGGGGGIRVLHRYDPASKTFRGLANIPFKVVGNEMELSIPTSHLKTGESLDINFKWTDNVPMLPVMKADEPPHRIFTEGDSAPDRRFNYNYKRTSFEEPKASTVK